MISWYHRWLQTACDENVITNDSLLPRPKYVYDGLYESLVKGQNVVANPCMNSVPFASGDSLRQRPMDLQPLLRSF